MRANTESYSAVAENCSEFSPTAKSDSYSNSMNEDKVSCMKCKHFDENEYCRLDLYDKIVKSKNIQQ